MSMNPGATTMPRASMVFRAGAPARSPMAAICPFRIPTSPAYQGEPVPSMMWPLRMTRSYGADAAANRSRGARTSIDTDHYRKAAGRCSQLTCLKPWPQPLGIPAVERVLQIRRQIDHRELLYRRFRGLDRKVGPKQELRLGRK